LSDADRQLLATLPDDERDLVKRAMRHRRPRERSKWLSPKCKSSEAPLCPKPFVLWVLLRSFKIPLVSHRAFAHSSALNTQRKTDAISP
jgi:hypothetical protein